MSLYDLNELDLNNVPELSPVPQDLEYKVRITEVVTGIDKNGNDYWRFRLEVVGEASAKDFGYFLGLPCRGQDAKTFDSKRRRLRGFLEAFGVETTSGFDPEVELPGREAWALLGVEDNGEYGMQNYVKKWVAGK